MLDRAAINRDWFSNIRADLLAGLDKDLEYGAGHWRRQATGRGIAGLATVQGIGDVQRIVLPLGEDMHVGAVSHHLCADPARSDPDRDFTAVVRDYRDHVPPPVGFDDE